MKTNHYTVTDTLFDIIALAMSDISDTSVDYEDDDGRIHDDDGSQDDSDQLPNDQDHNDQDEESSNDDEVDAVAVDTAPKDQDIDVSKWSLCPKHKSGFMIPDTCASCASGLSLISDQSVVRKLTSNNSAGSGILARYKGRCDSAAPTLALSNDTIQLALGIFTKGVFKDSRMWAEVVRNFLSLPSDQHELLNKDIGFEDVLNKFRKDKRFQNIFRYGNALAKCLKHLRISQRPLFALMERVNDDMERVKKIGEDAGINFDDIGSAPVRTGGHVPRVGRVLYNNLHVKSARDIFSIPDLTQFYDQLPETEAQTLQEVLETYRSSVGGQFLKLFNFIATLLNDSDDWLILYAE